MAGTVELSGLLLSDGLMSSIVYAVDLSEFVASDGLVVICWYCTRVDVSIVVLCCIAKQLFYCYFMWCFI